MKPSSTWSVKGIDSVTRELAKQAAHEKGLTLGQWLNEVIRKQAEHDADGSMPGDTKRGHDPEIVHKLDELAAQLRALVQKEQSTAVNRFASPDEDERRELARVIERLERNEAATAQALGEITARLDRLAGQMEEMSARPEQGAAAEELEAAVRNVVEHMELSETRTADMIDHIQKRLDDVSARAEEAAQLVSRQGDGNLLKEVEKRLDILNGRLAEMRDKVREDARAYVDAHMSRLSERVEAVYEASQGLPGRMEELVADVVEGRLGEVESRIDSMVARLRSRLDEMASVTLDAGSVESRIEELDRKLDRVAAQAASAEELEGMRAALEQLSLRVDAKADRKDIEAITKRLEMFIASLKAERSGKGETSRTGELEARVLELEKSLRGLKTPTGPETNEALTRLEESIRTIEARLGKAEGRLEHLPVLENSIAAVGRAMEEMQISSEEGSGNPSEEIRALQEGLEAVKQAASASEAKMRETLDAVHQTLAHIVEKLNAVDQEEAKVRNTSESGKAASPEERASDESRSPAPGSPAASGNAEGMKEDLARRLASEAAAAARAADSLSDDPVQTARSTSDIADHPRRNTDPAGKPESPEPLREDFIAAARRAAMTASGAAAEKEEESRQGLISLLRRHRASHEEPQKDGSASAASRSTAEPRTDSGRPKLFSLSFLGREREKQAEDTPAEGSGKETEGGRRRLLFMGLVLMAAVSAFMIRNQGEAPREATPATINAPSGQDGKAGDASVKPSAGDEDAIPVERGKRPSPARERLGLLNPSTSAGSGFASAISKAENSDGHSVLTTASIGNARDDTTMRKAEEEVHEIPGTLGTAALRKAAREGDPRAEFIIGSHYLDGRSVKRDFAKAAYWFAKAARKGIAVAQYRMGTLYERGRGVPRDAAKAMDWYRRAAEAGNVKAMHNLAVLLANGQGGKASYEEAAGWFRKAALHGLRDSQYNLAILYQRGLGVSRDIAEAYRWFGIAARTGDSDAARLKDALKSRLDGKTLKRLEREIAAWTPVKAKRDANFILVDRPEWRKKKEVRIVDGGASRKATGKIAGDATSRIRRIQELLLKLGYSVGAVDGKLGNRTANAIRLFQLQAGLQVNGQPTEEVLRMLERRARTARTSFGSSA